MVELSRKCSHCGMLVLHRNCVSGTAQKLNYLYFSLDQGVAKQLPSLNIHHLTVF